MPKMPNIPNMVGDIPYSWELGALDLVIHYLWVVYMAVHLRPLILIYADRLLWHLGSNPDRLNQLETRIKETKALSVSKKG